RSAAPKITSSRFHAPSPRLRRIGVSLSVCTGGRSRFVRALHETANAQEFAASASRRSFAARAVSRKSGSGSSRRGSNSTSQRLDGKRSDDITPQDFSGGSLLATSSATACSRFCTRARTKNSAIAALSPGTHLAVEKRDKNGARETQRSTCDTGQTIW